MEELFFMILPIFLIVILALGVCIVPQGSEYTVERWGRYTRTLTPGFNILVPIVERVGRKLSVMEQVLNVPSQEVITKDNAMVTVDGVVFYQVLDSAKAAYEVLQLNEAIENLTVTNIRTVMGSMDLDSLLSHRDEINGKLLSVVDLATNPWGVKVTRIEIKDITPPADLVDSMAGQMKAERDKRAAVLEAEGVRQSQILKAEGEKRSAILQAEGIKESTILEADGQKEAAFLDAEARERLAQAEARATAMVSQAVENGKVEALNYFIAQKYVQSLEMIASAENQKVIFMPLEATQVLGSLGGVGELVKEVFPHKDKDQ
ncbi:SPFH domain-containing protein [Magnetococcales bacterium HHB-1]